MDKKVCDLTKSLQTIAESCKLAAMPEAPEGDDDKLSAPLDVDNKEAEVPQCTIVDAFASLTEAQYNDVADSTNSTVK